LVPLQDPDKLICFACRTAENEPLYKRKREREKKISLEKFKDIFLFGGNIYNICV